MKILACTSIRSDYDLMSPLYELLDKDDDIELKLLVSGAHLSRNYGYSVEQIEKDGFNVLLRVETLISSDSAVSRVKTAGNLLLSSVDLINNYQPDLIIYAGDREDVLIYSIMGGYLNIPTAHFFAGDHAPDGYIDNPVRHATSKLSTAHFASLPIHGQRLIDLGENPKRIHVIGNIALDRFVSFTPLPIQELEKSLDLSIFDKGFAIVIFHPITEEKDVASTYFENILLALSNNGIPAYVGYPNVDPGNHSIIEVIQKYESDDNFVFYKNLDRQVFLSLYKNASLLIGNSSSGVCEAASVQIPVVNVGKRQVGRFADENVMFVDGEYEKIDNAIKTVTNDSFSDKLKTLKNSYGDGDSAQKAYNIIKKINFSELLAKPDDPLKSKIL
ncbi:UDP-N-acetylglucosamine 2-epimerase [Psychrobacter sp. Sarcosine-3u-12]|uniref:UDP-N-acetylglucosamine 2-epimerase n=1 Tax=Psychrobacter sp. Sarcosine-3u-12 TaxID=2058325 RepID=UPI000C349939|nr:UDP-N-acetylglucosamine 2-epimerase [Psychrobacter sp. Sarcosine-3u-12]PKG36067.1 UDP-N-acetylglucosamine 2-epimerase (hydrolyzing) [Psychrobacter sp. Sarcosine-3u-12]